MNIIAFQDFSTSEFTLKKSNVTQIGPRQKARRVGRERLLILIGT